MSERFEMGRVGADIEIVCSDGKYDGTLYGMAPRDAVTTFKNDCISIIDYCKSFGIVTVDLDFYTRDPSIHIYDVAFYINDQYVGYATLELVKRR